MLNYKKCEFWGSHNFTVRERDDRQTKKTHFGFIGDARSPSPTKLGMVIDDLKHVLPPGKRLEVRRSFAARRR